MSDPFLLHIFSATRHVSPFDINMAYEARYDAVIPYAGVTLEETRHLTQDTIFSRGPEGARRTAIFIGGRDFEQAMDMMEAARDAMVPPFEVSVLADPSGAITTAAALVACVAHYCPGALTDRDVYVFGGTGPVGICAALLADRLGARTRVVSHQGLGNAQKTADDANRRFRARLSGVDGSNAEAVAGLVEQAEVIISTAKAGVQVLDAGTLAGARRLQVVADANAVPPAGVEGVGVKDMGAPLAGTPGPALALGALAVGNIKYKVHTRLLRMIYEAEAPLYLGYPEALEVAREVVTEALGEGRT